MVSALDHDRLCVYILHPPDQDDYETLLKLIDENVEIQLGPDLSDTPGYHVLVAGRPTREHLEASPNLRHLVIPFAGLPEITRKIMLAYSHINVFNLHHNAAPTSEMAVALLLAAAKFLIPIDRQFRHGDWSPRYLPNPSVLLENKTALILGYGQVGLRVANVLRALGMEVLGLRRTAHGTSNSDFGSVEKLKIENLHALLPSTQIFIITAPLTDQTRGLIGETELKLLPEGALLVNVGRGPVVDQKALFHALKKKHLAGAGIDVWYNYPETPEARDSTNPSDFPFHTLDNVVMSPHRAGGSRETEKLRMKSLASTLNAIARGKTIPNRVDLEAGY